MYKVMAYHLKKKGKKYQIVRDEDKVVVGTSDSKAKAERSIGYRMEAIMKKEKQESKKKEKKMTMKSVFKPTQYGKKKDSGYKPMKVM